MSTQIDCLQCRRYASILHRRMKTVQDLCDTLPAHLLDRVVQLQLAFPDADFKGLVAVVIDNTLNQMQRGELSPPDDERACHWLGEPCSRLVEDMDADLHRFVSID